MLRLSNEPAPVIGVNPESIAAAIRVLRKAHEASLRERGDPWQFAVSLTELNACGLDGTDIRTLLAQGCLYHGMEIEKGRTCRIRRVTHLRISQRSCFVISPTRIAEFADGGLVHLKNNCADATSSVGPLKPYWNAASRQLTLGGRIVKEFRRPAPNQELLLAVFEDDG